MRDIATRTPIDRVAARVTAGGLALPQDLTRSELVHIVQRLRRKHRLLRYLLRLSGSRSHKNLIRKFNKGGTRAVSYREPRSVIEYAALGREIERLNRVLSGMARD